MFVCPFCGCELIDPCPNTGIAYCGRCKENVQSEAYEPDTDLLGEIQAEFDAEAEQDAYEANSENYGYDDDFNYRDRFFLDGEIL